MPKSKFNGKKFTVLLAMIWVLWLCFYASVLLGTLSHELMHKQEAINITAIEINYDTSGKAYGAFFRHSHEWVYLNGMIVENAIFLISMLSVLVIYNYSGDRIDKNKK